MPELRKLAPNVAKLADPQRQPGAVIDLLASLRNSIHGPVLSGKLYGSGGEVAISDFMRTTLAFDAQEAAEIRASLDVLSSDAVRWGAWDHDADTLLVAPGRFAEAATAAAAGVASEILHAMDQSRLAGQISSPPKGWLPDDRYRDNALLLVGLGSLDKTAPR